MNRFDDLLETLQKKAAKGAFGDVLKSLDSETSRDRDRQRQEPEREPELCLPYSSEPKHLEEPWA